MAYGGGTFLADTSAWTNIRKKSAPTDAKDEFWQAVDNGQILSSPIVRLEITWKARTKQEAFDKAKRLTVPELDLTPQIIEGAMDGLSQMIAAPHDVKKVPIPDALMAATAKAHGIGIVHYDFGDFPVLASYFGIEVVAVAPQGSI